jgi:protein-S-isoprenylcysteine O-methyltransferase Ste14
MKPRNWATVRPEQLPFIFSGKRYLLARLVVQIVLVVAFIVRFRGGQPLITGGSLAGAVLVAIGFILRRWSMRTMGARFRGFEVRREENGLATNGPYAVVCHPGYLGLMLMDVGLPLVFGVTWGLLLSAALVGLVVHRILLEEHLLRRTYDDYAAYASARKRVLPGVW